MDIQVAEAKPIRKLWYFGKILGSRAPAVVGSGQPAVKWVDDD
jgi:hypothetical protein